MVKSRWIAAVLILLVAPLFLVAGCGGGANGTSPTGAAGTSAALPRGWQARNPIIVGARGKASAYTPKQIRHAYGFDLLHIGTHTPPTIAIVDAYGSPTIAADLASFSTHFGLSAASLTIAYPQGNPTQGDQTWALETALDVEWVHAIAPHCPILLVVSKDASSNMFPCVAYAANHASVVSMSWGGPESAGEGALSSYFNHSGVAYVASSGDSGGLPGVPGVLSQVVCVGGTTLNLDGAGTIISETAWSYSATPFPQGSNGGPSAYISKPSWQSVNPTTKRECPDVCAVANPATGVAVYTSTPYQGYTGWLKVGGTSLSAPIWAALMGQAYGSTLNGVPAVLYSLTQTKSDYNTYFHDITSGSNQHYSCQPWYDMVTGIGSPKADKLVLALIGH